MKFKFKAERGTNGSRGAKGQRGSAAVRAVLWMLAGALVMLFLVVDPLGVSPVDGWLGVDRHADVGHPEGDGHGDRLWTCGMHP